MLGIDETKQDYKQLRSEISGLKKRLNGLKSQERSLAEEYSNIENRYQTEIRDAKLKDKDKFNYSITKPYEEKLKECESKLDALKEKYNKDMDENDDSHVDDFYTDEREILNEINSSTELLTEKINAILGPRFQAELNKQLSSKEVELTNLDLDEVIDYFNHESEKIEKMFSDSKFNILESASNIFAKFGDNFSFGNKNSVFIFIILNVVIAVIAYKIVFPIYVVLLTFFGVYNVIRCYRLYSAIISTKLVKDNLERITNKLKEDAYNELAENRANIETQFNKDKISLEHKIESLHNEINKALVSAEKLYYFDDTDLRESHDSLIKDLNSKRSKIKSEIFRCEKMLQDKTSKLQDLSGKMNELNSKIVSDYLNPEKVGDSYILEGNILFDIDDTGKPIIITIPQESCLFLYSSLEDVIDFIRLMCFQLRTQVIPQNLSFSLYDPIYLGKDFLLFTDSDLSKIFSILTSKDEIKEKTNSLSEEILKRTVNIKREFNTIDEYNKFMISQDSLTEPYDFFFLIDADFSTLNSVEFSQILINGGPLGLFTYVFVDIEKFCNGKENSRTLLDNISTVRVLQNGVLYNKAKNYVAEKIIKA